MFQGLSPPYLRTRYDSVIPGSEILEWFSHQSLGAELNIKEPYSHLCNELMGIVVCVVFCSQERHPHHQIDNHNDLSCWLIANGKEVCLQQPLGELQRLYQVTFGYSICVLSGTPSIPQNYCGNLMRMDSVRLELELKPIVQDLR